MAALAAQVGLLFWHFMRTLFMYKEIFSYANQFDGDI